MRKQTLKNCRRLVGRRTYTASELVRKLAIHRQTLRLWRKSGLAPTYTETHPWLYLGSVIKEFLRKQLADRKCKLGPDQFYCLFCRTARRAAKGSLQVVPTGKRFADGKLAAMRRGLCEKCGHKIRRAGSIDASDITDAGAER